MPIGRKKPINKRSLGTNLIGFTIAISNVLLFVSYYYTLLTHQASAPRQFVTFLSVLAVFPRDFFHTYMQPDWFAHLFWIMMMVICGMGILLLNKFARLVFIVMNIVHIIVLGYLAFMQFGRIDFVDFGFKLYFNLVVCGAYVGFLLIDDVREQFEVSLEGIKFMQWLEKPRVKRIRPQDSRGLYKLSLAYDNLGRHKDAVAVLEKAVAIEPENVDYLFRMGLINLKLEKNDKAIDAFRRVLRVQPAHYEASYFLGRSFLKEGSVLEGINALETATQSPRPHVNIYKELGEAYIAAGRYEEAARTLEKAGQVRERDPEVFYRLGRLCGEHLEQYKEAREHLLRAIRMDPDYSQAQMQLGLVCIKLNRYKDAIRAFKEVLRRDKDNKQAHYQLGFTYAMIQDYESARRHYRYLKHIDPDLAQNLGMLIK